MPDFPSLDAYGDEGDGRVIRYLIFAHSIGLKWEHMLIDLLHAVIDPRIRLA